MQKLQKIKVYSLLSDFLRESLQRNETRSLRSSDNIASSPNATGLPLKIYSKY
jgi:hypothetical protein